jgi:chaperonin GroES
MDEEIQPLGSRVLVRVLEEESVTRSGILLPDTAKEKPQRGEVVSIGDDDEMIKVRPQDTVLYPKYTGTEVMLDGGEHRILDAGDLVAVIRPPAAGAARAA